MSAARWGKTAGAYKKFCFIFEKELPVIVNSNAPLSDAVFIRDVLTYAKEQGLPGNNWYKKVTVSPQDNGTVIIKPKAAFAPELATKIIKEYNIFSLIHAIGTQEVKVGDRIHCNDSIEDINSALAIKGMQIKSFGGSLMELMAFYGENNG